MTKRLNKSLRYDRLTFESFRSFQQTWQLVLTNIDLPFVHKIDDGFQIQEPDILQNDNGMFARIAWKETLKVWRAGSQDHLVCFHVLAFACKCHVNHVFVDQHSLENFIHVGLIVIPFEAELLLIHDREWFSCLKVFRRINLWCAIVRGMVSAWSMIELRKKWCREDAPSLDSDESGAELQFTYQSWNSLWVESAPRQ